jgi:hypothetical protein
VCSAAEEDRFQGDRQRLIGPDSQSVVLARFVNVQRSLVASIVANLHPPSDSSTMHLDHLELWVSREEKSTLVKERKGIQNSQANEQK